MSATWDKAWPFDPTSDLPPDGATATVQDGLSFLHNVTFTFDAARGYWAGGGIVAYPFSGAGIGLASIWTRGLSS